MIRLAAFLKANSTAHFHIHMAGSGEMEESLKAMAKEEKVEDVLTFYGFLPPERVREIMEKCHIHVFTSNHLEGWGAVVNESMNSGCAVVANVEAGAVPSLIVPGKNGMIYNRSFEEMASQVLYLFSHKEERQNMGRAAYETITGLWNAEHGAKELIRFAGEILEGEPEPAAEGPLSPAPVIAPGKMYGELKRKGRI
jgi:glycosyltransferase involved in cell wall biosynthesis